MKRPLEPKMEAGLRAAEIAHRPDFSGELRAATASRISRSRRLAIRLVSSRVVKSATPTPFFVSGAIQSVSSKGSVVRSCSAAPRAAGRALRSEEHTSELQSRFDLVCRLLLEKKKKEREQVSPTIIV